MTATLLVPSLIALDLFAGTGWGVACQRLGIEEHGVELMPEAIATRTANGMTTVYKDVWDGLEDPTLVPNHDILIASPPCQTFSMAGKGAGRAALSEVLSLIASDAWRYGAHLRGVADDAGLDDRTALVLSPLAYVAQHRPTFVALEQVPTVLPVWEAVADVMRDLGYSVEVGVLSSEQYGVPQTRKRAILVARRDGQEAHLPDPTHSRYYPRDPQRLDGGVLPWVSMAEALGWTSESVVRSNYGTGGNAACRGERNGTEPAATVTSKIGRNVVYRNGNQAKAARRALDSPAPTVHFGRRSNKVEWIEPELARVPRASGDRVSPEEAATIQSYPDDFVWVGSKSTRYLQIGNAVPPLLAESILRTFLD